MPPHPPLLSAPTSFHMLKPNPFSEGIHGLGLWELLDHEGSVQSLSHVGLLKTPWTAARQASLSITNSWSSPKLMSIQSVMPSNHSWRWALHKWDKCPCKRDPRALPWPFCCVRTQPRQPSMNQEEGSHQTLNLLAPWSSPSQAPEFREINVHYLSHAYYGIFVIAADQQ